MSFFKEKLIKDREKLKRIKNYINNSNYNLELYNLRKSGCYKPKSIFKGFYKLGGDR